jgi:hypothetical protein
MVDAADSKSASGDRVGVQVPSAVPPNNSAVCHRRQAAFWSHHSDRHKTLVI